MRVDTRVVALAALLGWGAPLPAAAQGALGDGVDRLEEGVEAAGESVEKRIGEIPLLGELSRRIKLSASALGVVWDAQEDSQVAAERTQIWDARFFVDVLLAENVKIGDQTLVGAIGTSFEWEQVRLGEVENDYGEVYLELQGLAGSSWANAQVGRFNIPVGENYLRYSKGYRDNPFISNAIGGPWWPDEGVKLYGADESGRFGYVASFTGGETPREWNFDDGDQYSLKLFAKPTPWLHVSVSGLHSEGMGSAEYRASSALWLGEGWGRAFGNRAPSFHDGAVVPSGPGRIHGTTFLGADAVFTHPRGARLWVSYGTHEIDSSGPELYDRRLHTWLVELLLDGRLVSPELNRFYVALRANGVGTYDRSEGYLLDVRYSGLGFNMRSLDAYSFAVGWHLTKWVTLRVEYTLQDIALVRGASALGSVDRADYFGAALGLHF